jgi:8-oxo-dGTP diphosphatase
LEFGETIEACAERETREEAGIEIANLKSVAFTNDIYEKEQKHYVTVLVSADYVSGEVRVVEPDKFAEWQWFSWDALPEPLLLPITNLLKQGYSPF